MLVCIMNLLVVVFGVGLLGIGCVMFFCDFGCVMMGVGSIGMLFDCGCGVLSCVSG